MVSAPLLTAMEDIARTRTPEYQKGNPTEFRGLGTYLIIDLGRAVSAEANKRSS